MVSPIAPIFTWQDGKLRSPQEVSREREIAEALMFAKPQATGPFGALGQIGSALSGSLLDSRADAYTEQGREAASNLFAGLGSGSSADAISSALLNPAAEWATPAQSGIAEALFNNELQQSDPAYQLDLQYKQAQLDALRNPVADNPYLNVGGGSIFNSATGEFMTAPGVGAADLPSDVEEYNWYAQQEAAAGREPMGYLEFQNALKGNGFSVTTADGTVIQQGGAQRPLTEAQSKDTVYATRAAGALPILDQMGSALTDPVQRAMELDPTGIVRGNQSPEFQQANQAGLEFLQAILRKDTGAAITAEEQNQYGRVYLPQPGDSPEVLEQKRVSRQRALAAIEAGIPPQGILNQEKALQETGQPNQDGWQEVAPGIRIRPIGQ